MVCWTGQKRSRKKDRREMPDYDFKGCFTGLLYTRVYPKKKYMGNWHDVKDILFKGYIFMITDQIDQLNIELKNT